MKIGGIHFPSTIDYMGEVAIIVFMAGCNYDCFFCHNSTLIPIDSGKDMNLDTLEAELKSYAEFADAVVFTGGEPTIQGDDLISACKIARGLGLKILVDTNGSQPDVLEKLLKRYKISIDGIITETNLVDRIALDIKNVLSSKAYSKTISMPDTVDRPDAYRIVRNTLEMLTNYDVEVECRTTVAPNVITSSEIKSIAKEIAPVADTYILQQYIESENVRFPIHEKLSYENLMKYGRIANEYIDNVYVKTKLNGVQKIEKET